MDYHNQYKYNTIEITQDGDTVTVWLNRPEVKNAFNQVMVAELLKVFQLLTTDQTCNVVLIRGKGDTFCSGADLQWMKDMGEAPFDINIADGERMAECFFTLYSLPKPVLTVVHGSVMGGGIGLLAASDIAICSKNSTFAFSEVKLGLVPAVIAPYVLQRIGTANARELFLTGKKFNEHKALSIGLVNMVSEENELDNCMWSYINEFHKNNPEAIQQTKLLLNKLSGFDNFNEIKAYTANIIANARKSADGREGINAFFEKRKPVWIK